MHTYNATIRLNAKLENEVNKNNLTAPEVLLLRKIHGDDAVVKIEDSGFWEDHFSKRNIKDEEGNEEEIEVEYDTDAEKDRLAHLYGDAVIVDDDRGIPRAAIDRMFGEYAPLPAELPELKKARQAEAKEKQKQAEVKETGKKGNLGKVA